MDNLVQHIETLMNGDDVSLARKHSTSSVTSQSHSTITKPISQLSPKTQKEIHSLLKETADALDVTNVSIDDSRSSLQLLRSIIIEAGKRFGLNEASWVHQIQVQQKFHVSQESNEGREIPEDSPDLYCKKNKAASKPKKGILPCQ